MKIRFLPRIAFFLLLVCANSIVWGKSQEQADKINFGFYVQADSLNFYGDTIDLIGPNTFKSGVNIPRARFSVRGKLSDWYYSLAYDASQEAIREAFLRYEKFKNFRFYLGQFKAPYDFWFLTRHNHLEFLELGLPTIAFNPGFRVGLQSRFLVDPCTISLAMLAPEANNTLMGNNLKGHTPLAANARFTYSPIHKKKLALHFATAGIFQDTDSLGRFRFRTFPEVQTYHNHFLVDTGYIYNCKNYLSQQLETAMLLGPLTFVAQYYQTLVNRNPRDLHFRGEVFTLSYFLTGEHYVYDFNEGAVSDYAEIIHCYGAWQLVSRYSQVNLMNENVIKGGREDNITVGLNWLANSNAKFMLEYIYANADPACNGLYRHLNILGLRFQLTAQSL